MSENQKVIRIVKKRSIRIEPPKNRDEQKSDNVEKNVETKVEKKSEAKSEKKVEKKVETKVEAKIEKKVETKVEKKIEKIEPAAKNQDTIITLKRITHNEVHDLYLSGHFINKQIKQTILVNDKVKLCKEFSDNPCAGIFVSDPNKKNGIVLCSTNQKDFDYYMVLNKQNDDGKEKICDWCRIKFTHRSKGMAIAYTELYYNDKLCRIFWIYGCHCDERCALAEIEEEERKSTHLSSLNLPTCRTMTNFLYFVTTGKDPEELKPRCYWRLLKRNGGSIEDEDEPRNIFKETGSLYLLPAKMLFEKYEL